MWIIHGALQFANVFLKVFKKNLLAEGDFLGTYVTTIGKKIYAQPIWTDETPPSRLVVHELTHVLQHKRHGLRFSLGYLFSKKRRLFYETEAYQTECLCFPGILDNEDIFEDRVTMLEAYGLSKHTIIRELESRRQEIKAETPRVCSDRIHTAWIEWHQLNEDEEKEDSEEE